MKSPRMKRTSLWLLATFFASPSIGSSSHDTEPPPPISLTAKLSNGIPIPLVGMGIGNLPHDLIREAVYANFQPGMDVQLVDTAHASNNERILGDAIASFDNEQRKNIDDGSTANALHRRTRGGGGIVSAEELPPIHVVTKVWYTHLGYERTKLSVHDSLKELQSAHSSSASNTKPRQMYVHMLLHWPRCNDDIPWMHCEEEELGLPQSVKELGTAPHLDKENSWKGSWKALEDLYIEHAPKREGKKSVNEPVIASIGVSNFELEDMKALKDLARIPPHIYQGNSWLVFHDPYLMNWLRDNDIFIQAYGVMNGILQRKEESPAAYNILTNVSKELAATTHSYMSENDGGGDRKHPPVITEATVLLSFFLRSNIGIIPRASSSAHQKENSPVSITAILSHLTSLHIKQLEMAIKALMKGEALHASISFMNSLPGPIQIHWIHPETEEEVLVSNGVHSGAVEVMNTHPNHRFVAYDTEREVRREFRVTVGYGEQEHFHVEL